MTCGILSPGRRQAPFVSGRDAVTMTPPPFDRGRPHTSPGGVLRFTHLFHVYHPHRPARGGQAPQRRSHRRFRRPPIPFLSGTPPPRPEPDRRPARPARRPGESPLFTPPDRAGQHRGPGTPGRLAEDL